MSAAVRGKRTTSRRGYRRQHGSTRLKGFGQRDGAILNRQRTVRVQLRQMDHFIARAQRALRLPPEAFSVCLVTNAEIARWNLAYRHKNGPTDVLSFPSDDESGGSIHGKFSRRVSLARDRYLGDIAIAPAVARRNARRFGRTLSQELRILILHGMLHLLGYDHETDTGEMDRRERRLRRQLGLG